MTAGPLENKRGESSREKIHQEEKQRVYVRRELWSPLANKFEIVSKLISAIGNFKF